jgi:hypothetical protein
LDVIREPIVWFKPDELVLACKKERSALPPLTAFDFCDGNVKKMTDNFQPLANAAPMRLFVNVVNTIVTEGCPWATVVVDSVSGLNDIILSFISSTNAAILSDPRKWAGLAGGKVAQMMGVITSLPCHCVFIFHEALKDNEKTGDTFVRPLVPSQFRDRVGGLCSQWLYACKVNGVPKVRTTDYGLVNGIGCRWPHELEPLCGPSFQDIYGKYFSDTKS